MKKFPIPFVVAALLILGGFIAFVVWGVPYFFRPFSFVTSGDGFGSQTVRAQVTEILEQGQVDLDGTLQNYQVMRVRLLEGAYQGVLMEVDYGKRQLRPDSILFATGEEIYVTIDKRPWRWLSACW
ncbi:MAG: hypothetical protein NT121_24150 [Chloroflexi bacterium]|nr:hypothetical protein [Chloroflexota bacterium]